jgi:hypothetical protein
MVEIADIKKRILNIPELINESIEEAFFDNREQIENMNRDQLRKGKRGDGVTLPDYSRASVVVYGKPAGPIRLFDQGDFYKGITLDVDNDEAHLLGTDEKTDELERTYGNSIIELSEENKKIIRDEMIKPTIFKRIIDG